MNLLVVGQSFSLCIRDICAGSHKLLSWLEKRFQLMHIGCHPRWYVTLLCFWECGRFWLLGVLPSSGLRGRGLPGKRGRKTHFGERELPPSSRSPLPPSIMHNTTATDSSMTPRDSLTPAMDYLKIPFFPQQTWIQTAFT